MKTYLTYGGAMAIAGAVLVLALFFLGFHTEAAKLDSAQTIGLIGGLGIGIVCIVLGTKARLAEVPLTEDFGYGRALGTGVMIVLFASLFGLVTNFIYFHFINPGFTDLIIQAQLDKMAEKGMNGAQLEQAEKITRMVMKPGLQAIFGFCGGMFSGTIISLITAAFLKRPANDEVAAENPPPLG